MNEMNNSDLILKTFTEIVTKLEQHYYILEGLSGNEGRTQILFISPSIKNIIGLSQYELLSNPKLFLDSIHPSQLKDYLESNEKLLSNCCKVKRFYQIKNHLTEEFIPVEELAISRLNEEKNCFEIYCTIKQLNNHIDNSIGTPVNASNGLLKNETTKQASITKLVGVVSYFLNVMEMNFKMDGCRFYAYNANKKELLFLADTQNKKVQEELEKNANIKTKYVIPHYPEDKYFFEIVEKNNYYITSDKLEIAAILRYYTHSPLLKQFAKVAVNIYHLKSFGVMPLRDQNGKIVGVVTFGSGNIYTEEEKKSIAELISTTLLSLTSLLENVSD